MKCKIKKNDKNKEVGAVRDKSCSHNSHGREITIVQNCENSQSTQVNVKILALPYSAASPYERGEGKIPYSLRAAWSGYAPG